MSRPDDTPWRPPADHAEFRTGWFVESLATQTLVIYVIRTRRVPFLRSRPSPAMLVVPIGCAAIGAVLPFTALHQVLGFTALPLSFFLILVGMSPARLVLAEIAKSRWYAAQERPAGRRGRPIGSGSSAGSGVRRRRSSATSFRVGRADGERDQRWPIVSDSRGARGD